MSNNIVPRKGPDLEKIKKIRGVLRENPEGLWIREIARQAGLDKSTVSIYLSKYMKEEMEEVVKIKNVPIKLVKLRWKK